MTVGVLALQGAFAKHQQIVEQLGFQTLAVRYADELANCSALIIPGGESSTISLQLDNNGLREAVTEFARNHPVMGTCAGLILMAQKTDSRMVTTLGLLDISVSRNGWGRQVHSFTANITIALDNGSADVPAVFIRAPRIDKTGPGVEVLGSYDHQPVLVRQGGHLGVTFHPELTGDQSIHDLFLKSVVT
ncbi:MAG: pyridoxal 5'-phosphate synthase glutaminase subunit PdxT [Candidatus Marinimicrobia bacterium]|nr:pyridoxal 5'-phosphate synthase glutaminase subunit PdxT [Candidatus Neomarinimicrobiota bacterium]